MVLAPAELRELRGHRCSIADFRSALVSPGRSLALDFGCSDRSLYPLAKGAEPNEVNQGRLITNRPAPRLV